jgi:hypothetical protein
VRMLILGRVVRRVARPISDWVVPRERAVRVSRLPCPRPRVCLAGCPGEPGHACLAAARCAELLRLVSPWFSARSRAPVGVRAACPWSCQTGRLLPLLASPWAGAVLSILFLPGKARPQAWERTEPASEGDSKAQPDAQVLACGLFLGPARAAGEKSQDAPSSPQPVLAAACFPTGFPPAALPARQIRANRLPGSNTSAHPSKANGSAAWRPGRAPLPVPAIETPPGRERSRSLRSRRRRPTAGTWIPAAKARSPARCRRPW